jgi:hypothetical protein
VYVKLHDVINVGCPHSIGAGKQVLGFVRLDCLSLRNLSKSQPNRKT